MNVLFSVLSAATPSPGSEESLRPGLEPGQVSPGLLGFIATFVLVVAVVLLILDFNRRNRRLRYRAEYAQQRALEEQVGGYSPAEGAASRSDRGATQGVDGATSASSQDPTASHGIDPKDRHRD